ncbi:MAG: helix-turn-helix transcriptional regulator [Brevundimonas sp.]|jgi:transcriptional regulator with XRE-family HTH domain|nr:helix-turn-helix transcriptional regulator [Brevundimonas sp.]
MGRFRKPPERLQIAARLLEMREHLRLSQAEMAESLDLSLRAYRNYEQGLRDLPGQTYLKIFERYDLDPLWLYRGEGWGPAVRHKGMEADLWRIAVDAVEQTLAETGVELPGTKRRALYEAVVDHLRQGGEADAKAVGALVRLAA